MTETGAYDKAEIHLRAALELLEAVGNPKQIWTTRSHLARLYNEMKRHDLARQQWGAAAEVIQMTANGLSDSQLRHGFLEAGPVREILARAES
jgi:hypothetical protein